jgi:hypothetical protein
MNHLKTFEAFDASWAKKYRKNKFIGDVKDSVEIRIDLEAVPHVLDRQYRHGIDDLIKEEEIIDLVERSIEELTIALMQDRLNIEERFVLKDKKTHLNCVCILQPEEDNFKLLVITVMRKENFSTPSDQYVLEL